MHHIVVAGPQLCMSSKRAFRACSGVGLPIAPAATASFRFWISGALLDGAGTDVPYDLDSARLPDAHAVDRLRPTEKFHHGSIMKTRLARVRLIPTPPARADTHYCRVSRSRTFVWARGGHGHATTNNDTSKWLLNGGQLRPMRSRST